jgi:GNAT superfamily N-acetyltransferase
MLINEYTLRPSTSADVPAVVALYERWAEENCTIDVTPTSAEVVSGWIGPLCWVAVSPIGATVGFIYGNIKMSEGNGAVVADGESYLWPEELYVAPEHRHQGIGGRLLDALLAQAAAQGITRALVYSAARDWQAIIEFYQRHGFTMWCVELCR